MTYEQFYEAYSALRFACQRTHTEGGNGVWLNPDGTPLCICGAPLPGSEACNGLRALRDLIAELEPQLTLPHRRVMG